MCLPCLGEFGWEAHVLAVDSRYVEDVMDHDLLLTLPRQVPITRVGAVPFQLTRHFGFGGLDYRALAALYIGGLRLLQRERFDLVYFSTTAFLCMILGPLWKQRFGIPFVVDLQDPWLSSYYEATGAPPPGGALKYKLNQWLAHRFEPRTMRNAAHIISVSPAYPAMLKARYPEMDSSRFTVLPFGAAALDFEITRKMAITQSIFDANDGLIHWVYLGRGGPDMALALRGLFLAVRALVGENHSNLARLRLHFVGTSYAAKEIAERTIEPVAAEVGVAHMVAELTSRIPYLEGLALLQASDIVLVVGSDDPGYTASKIYPCILAGRPILAILHESSSAGEIIRRCRAGNVIGFSTGDSPETIAGRLQPVIRLLLSGAPNPRPATDWQACKPFTAREMTRRQCEVFDAVVGKPVRAS